MTGGRMRTGTDLVEVPRLRAALARRPTLAERVLTPAELAYCRGKADPVPSVAARVAAKEAVGKLLGTGILSWQEIEVVPGGPPCVRLHGSTATWAASLGIDHIALSLSHTAGAALATAVAEARSSMPAGSLCPARRLRLQFGASSLTCPWRPDLSACDRLKCAHSTGRPSTTWVSQGRCSWREPPSGWPSSCCAGTPGAIPLSRVAEVTTAETGWLPPDSCTWPAIR